MSFLAAFAYILAHKYYFYPTKLYTHTKVFYTHKIYQIDLEGANCYTECINFFFLVNYWRIFMLWLGLYYITRKDFVTSVFQHPSQETFIKFVDQHFNQS